LIFSVVSYPFILISYAPKKVGYIFMDVTIHKDIVSKQELLEEIRRVAASIPKAER